VLFGRKIRLVVRLAQRRVRSSCHIDLRAYRSAARQHLPCIVIPFVISGMGQYVPSYMWAHTHACRCDSIEIITGPCFWPIHPSSRRVLDVSIYGVVYFSPPPLSSRVCCAKADDTMLLLSLMAQPLPFPQRRFIT